MARGLLEENRLAYVLETQEKRKILSDNDRQMEEIQSSRRHEWHSDCRRILADRRALLQDYEISLDKQERNWKFP